MMVPQVILQKIRSLYSSAPIQVTMKVQVKEKEDPGVDPDGGDNQGGDNPRWR